MVLAGQVNQWLWVGIYTLLDETICAQMIHVWVIRIMLYGRGHVKRRYSVL